ncbi:hypothetical protein PanWU01x14_040220 [Parasponia andersonii]|uniref:Uncharacterized protein n=1 Tax=Parasponia andersonii TaxID=3476 RepID=A0A2P5DR54_PARAD|nr:hypothetical protein PanWU01x14_040220 [Parasponia andersonii]
MGNVIMSPSCFKPNPNSAVKLIFWEGTARILTGKKHIAGEIMVEFPDRMVCHADSFFIGHPVPALGIHDELFGGQTYFVLPIDRFACGVLSAASLAAFGSSPSPNDKAASPINLCGTNSPFEYLRGSNGRVLIKVSPEFITKLVMKGKEIGSGSPSNNGSFLCSTPELQKHYEQLVGSKEQVWSPKLETISEHRIRFSPCRFIGLEWKVKENEVL